MTDAISEERLQQVHPRLAAAVRAAADELAQEGTYFRVAQGLRTYAEQDALYAQGRTAPGHIVTNARGGYSNHNFGYWSSLKSTALAPETGTADNEAWT